MVVDAHTHIFTESEYQAYQDKARGRVSKIISIYDPWPWQDQPITLAELIAFAETKKDLFVVGAIDIEKDMAAQLDVMETYFKSGQLVGLKLYPGYQHFYPSDPIVFPVARLCQRYHKPLIVHTGDVYDNAHPPLLKYAQPLHLDELAVHFPDCSIIMAHFGFPYLMEAANILVKNANVYADISGTIVNFEVASDTTRLIEQYIHDLQHVLAYFPLVSQKTLFGTDYSNESLLSLVAPYLDVVERVFTPEQQAAIFGETAERLFFSSAATAS